MKKKSYLRGERFARAEHMQKLNRSRFFSRYGDSLPIFFKKMEKEKPQLPQERTRKKRYIQEERASSLNSWWAEGGHTWAEGEKVKPFVVKYEFQNSLMYILCPPPPKPKIGLLLAHL